METYSTPNTKEDKMESSPRKTTVIHTTAIGKVIRFEVQAPLGIHVWYGFEAHDGSCCWQGHKLERMMAKADGKM